ncbi:MAG TPA: translation initiation factor IF-3 [Candidatus Peregrinibacteria bacterium]|nr:translation initiation factor IF-3 [Candidatus Peregrinibacteria bacterium]
MATPRLRVNAGIRALTVRLIDGEGEQVGVMSVEKALEIAKEKGLDLVEASPKAKPPVCKIMDYGKYLYHQKKKDQKQKKMQKKTEIKGVRLGLNIDKHDLAVKLKQARKFLGDRNVVKVVMIFRGRQRMYGDLGREKMLGFAKEVADIADVEMNPKKQGYQMIMILNPKK